MPAVTTRPAARAFFPERDPAIPTVTVPATPPAISVSTVRPPSVRIMTIISVLRNMWISRAVARAIAGRRFAPPSRRRKPGIPAPAAYPGGGTAGFYIFLHNIVDRADNVWYTSLVRKAQTTKQSIHSHLTAAGW